jgi:uncharacterized protein YdeI (YjbR/CyaY-like superfamily)
MSKFKLHIITPNLKKALKLNQSANLTWDSITELAKNEWICWIESAKQEETKLKRLNLAIDQLSNGKRRPCCWPGCPHRKPDIMKYFKPPKKT